MNASLRSAALVPTPTRSTASCLVHACGLGESSNRLWLSWLYRPSTTSAKLCAVVWKPIAEESAPSAALPSPDATAKLPGAFVSLPLSVATLPLSSSTSPGRAASLSRLACASTPSSSPHRLTMPSAVQTRPSLNTVSASLRSSALVPTPTRKAASCRLHALMLGESANLLWLSWLYCPTTTSP